MNEFLYLNNILKYCKKTNTKNVLLQTSYAPYDLDLKKHLTYFETIDSKIINYINKNVLKNKEYIISSFINTNYLLKLVGETIFIRELDTTNQRLNLNEINRFIFGVKNFKIIFKDDNLLEKHIATYSLINSIRELCDDTIVIIESDKSL